MYSLIAFATQWGSKYGGINSFNTDFISAFGLAYPADVQVICIVTDADDNEIAAAKKVHVTLVKLPYPPKNKAFAEDHATAAVDELNKRSIPFEPESTVWLGHDRISGNAAIHAAKLTGGRSALIHHMSYDLYEAFAENSQSAQGKKQQQKTLFKQADILLAVGPLLRDALADLVNGNPKPIHMIIPGLAEITPKAVPNFFTAFLSGRLDENAAKIKQGHLGVAAFAKAVKAKTKNLKHNAKMVLRGVDFESCQNYGKDRAQTNPEQELHEFAEHYAGQVITLHALPYTQDREELYEDLSAASVALMPSWHEGFGLVAWEAIAAGVPVIVSENSGVYQFIHEFLKQNHPGTEQGLITSIIVGGSNREPFFREQDLDDLVNKITVIANDPSAARTRALSLREKLSAYSWSHCVGNVAGHFGWSTLKEISGNDQNDDFACKVRDKIKDILSKDKPAVLALCEVLLKNQPLGARPEDVLIPKNNPILPESIIREWRKTVLACLQQTHSHTVEIKRFASEIMGWLILLCVVDGKFSIDFDKAGEIVVPYNTSAGIEVFVARLEQRPASLLFEGNDKVLGDGYVNFVDIELGLDTPDCLQQIKKLIYCQVFKKEPVLGDDWLKRLRKTIELHAVDDRKNYYFSLPLTRRSELMETIKQLKACLPELRILITGTLEDGSQSIGIMAEGELEALIIHFLTALA